MKTNLYKLRRIMTIFIATCFSILFVTYNEMQKIKKKESTLVDMSFYKKRNTSDKRH